MFRLLLTLFLAIYVMLDMVQAQDNLNRQIQKYQNINWTDYRVATLRKKISTKLYGNSISLISIKKMNFLPRSSIYEQRGIWSRAGILWPDMIVLSSGRYDLQTLYKSLHNTKLIEKTAKNTYLIKRPIYISPTASLLINKSIMRLSLTHGVYIIYHGNLDVLDSSIMSWNSKTNNFGPRQHIEESKLLFYLEQNTRPYVLGLDGSFTRIINSEIVGLGYKGQVGSYGISLIKSNSEVRMGSFKRFLKKRNQPKGIFIGNNISQCFYGFYTNNAKDVVLAGNILHDNVISNFDPHDYSTNLIIAKNVSYKAGHAHGIIISREVNDSIIADNITFLNAGSGLMLDRKSENNFIYSNLSFLNKGDGISIYESDRNILTENIMVQNHNNGLFVRNSSEVKANKNYFLQNGNNGAEVSVVNIDGLGVRNFTLDPYDKKSQALFENNTFERNVNSALSVKNGASFFFKGNTLQDSGPLYFSGEVEDLTPEIILKNDGEGFSYKPQNSHP